MSTVVFAAYHPVFDSRQVLFFTTADQHNVMFLQIVPLARNEGNDLFPGRKLHADTLSVGGVWFLRFLDDDFQHHTFLLRALVQRAVAIEVTRFLGRPFVVHLLQCGHRAVLRQDWRDGSRSTATG